MEDVTQVNAKAAKCVVSFLETHLKVKLEGGLQVLLQTWDLVALSDHIAQALRDHGNAKLEEAAKVADRWHAFPAEEVAGQIRQLKDKP